MVSARVHAGCALPGHTYMGEKRKFLEATKDAEHTHSHTRTHT